jgi:hypothetical protein
VQGDHGLAGAGPALDDQHAGLRRADDLVLLGLDRGDDVAERAGAAAFEGGEQRRVAADRRLVVDEALVVAEANSSSSIPSTVRPSTAKWRRRTSPIGSRPVAR